MNKTQLVDAIAKKASITKVDAKKALDAFINVTGEALKAGDKIALIGFGSFAVAKKPGRTGRNPRTGAAIKIARKERREIQGRRRTERAGEIVFAPLRKLLRKNAEPVNGSIKAAAKGHPFAAACS